MKELHIIQINYKLFFSGKFKMRMIFYRFIDAGLFIFSLSDPHSLTS